ncbi:pyridoxamine 5'-phosphate oxidase family protein [Hufsiella ginkgonis]|uniref:Pyridoxamine 5'-phosphate oxidase family protein n=1 Tax=Hufsiella ginkgonis TaxID=2695274 RepID=A0A7K1XRX8_9SPHI|nr:pyridoxamine 5'-phosphate oxidase family protein [Hufsiella ginkgonis]MXV13751.1 pyridoxamine 5'-phosphate oxidase family protein [Hufsiella ginkgonis]
MEEKSSIENLNGAAAVQKIRDLAENSMSCVMQTALTDRPIPSRPMGVNRSDESGRLYFLSHRGSGKNADILKSPEMQITINNDKDLEYLSLFGSAEVYREQALIDEMYSPFADNWFDGKEDPAITINRFTPKSGHYWNAKHGKLVQFAHILVGAITGKKSDDGVEGEILL